MTGASRTKWRFDEWRIRRGEVPTQPVRCGYSVRRRLWRATGPTDNMRCEPTALVSSSMIDFLERSLKSVILFGQSALAGGNLWILVLFVLVAFGVIAVVRGKLSDSTWLWIPLLALAMWYAFYRWLALRA